MLAWFRDRTIATKVFAAAAVLAVAMVCVGSIAFLSLLQMHNAKKELHQASERLFVSGRAAGYLLSYVTDVRAQTSELTLAQRQKYEREAE